MKKRHVFVTSDWHLGGTGDTREPSQPATPGTCICRSVEQLTEFIDWIRCKSTDFDGVTELVVNGDMVDFLAPDEGYVPQRWLGDQVAACDRFKQIVTQSVGSSGRGPFDAMRELLQEGCDLTILLGNHDIELSLPAVRQAIEDVLQVTSGRFRFVYDGEACVRGKLLVEHGNRYDPLNVVNFSRLRHERSHLSRGLSCSEDERGEEFFLPPYGSEMVANVLNNLLPQAPFLNLLKPEDEAAIPLVLALCPETRKLIQVAWEKMWKIPRVNRANRLKSSAQPHGGNLKPSKSDYYKSLDVFLEETLGTDAMAFLGDKQPSTGNLSVRKNIQVTLRWLITQGSKLNEMFRLPPVLNILTTRSDTKRVTQLKIALRKAAEASTFDLNAEESNYKDAAIEMMKDGGHDVVVFGHTHLPKHITTEHGTYFNCGTWADVMSLPDAFTDDDEKIALDAMTEFLEDMVNRNIEPYRQECLTYVEATVDEEGGVTAHLYRFDGAGCERVLISESK